MEYHAGDVCDFLERQHHRIDPESNTTRGKLVEEAEAHRGAGFALVFIEMTRWEKEGNWDFTVTRTGIRVIQERLGWTDEIREENRRLDAIVGWNLLASRRKDRLANLAYSDANRYRSIAREAEGDRQELLRTVGEVTCDD